MKKNKRLLILVAIVLVVVLVLIGIIKPKNSKELLSNYNNSKIGNDITSYILDLRVFNKTDYNKIINIKNYNNKNMYIRITDVNADENIYLFDGSKKYLFLADQNKYRQTERDYVFDNPEIFMEGLKEIKSVTPIEEKEDDVSSTEKYKKYKVEFSQSFVKDLLKDIKIDSSIKKDVSGEVWIDKDNRVFKVYYYVNDFTIYASYYGYNTVDADIVLRELS